MLPDVSLNDWIKMFFSCLHSERGAMQQTSCSRVFRGGSAVLRQVISTYPLLNTVETLTAAGTLISKVKGQFNCHDKLIFFKLSLVPPPHTLTYVCNDMKQIIQPRASDEQSHIRYEQIPHNQHLILWRKNMYNMQTWTIEIQVFPLLHLNVMSLLVLFVIKAEACVCDCEVVLFSVFVRVQLWSTTDAQKKDFEKAIEDHCCGLQQQVRPPLCFHTEYLLIYYL